MTHLNFALPLPLSLSLSRSLSLSLSLSHTHTHSLPPSNPLQSRALCVCACCGHGRVSCVYYSSVRCADCYNNCNAFTHAEFTCRNKMCRKISQTANQSFSPIQRVPASLSSLPLPSSQVNTSRFWNKLLLLRA